MSDIRNYMIRPVGTDKPTEAMHQPETQSFVVVQQVDVPQITQEQQPTDSGTAAVREGPEKKTQAPWMIVVAARRALQQLRDEKY